MKNNKSMQLNWCNTISEFCEKINNELNTHICEYDFDWFDNVLEINVYCQLHDNINHMVIDVYRNGICEYCGHGLIKTYDALYDVMYKNALHIKTLNFEKTVIEPTNNAVVFALNAYFKNVHFNNEPVHNNDQFCIIIDDIINTENYYRIFLQYNDNDTIDVMFQYIDHDICDYTVHNEHNDLVSDDIFTLIVAILQFYMNVLKFDNE